jgi:SAM-dependent methyltransferase
MTNELINSSTSPEFFESLYTNDADPWSFATSRYEQQRYAAIISALLDRRYLRAFEPGCSIGILTAALAPFCDRLTAIDISPTAVQNAQKYCQRFSHVEVNVGSLPEDMPDGLFDLIVFSEIGYYFTENNLLNLGTVLASRLSRGGILLAAHWLGESPDHALSGDRVHQIFDEIQGLHPDHAELHEGFRLNKWTRL